MGGNPSAVFALIEVKSGGIAPEIEVVAYAVFLGFKRGRDVGKRLLQRAASMIPRWRFVDPQTRFLARKFAFCRLEEHLHGRHIPSGCRLGLEVSHQQDLSDFFDDDFWQPAMLWRHQSYGLVLSELAMPLFDPLAQGFEDGREWRFVEQEGRGCPERGQIGL